MQHILIGLKIGYEKTLAKAEILAVTGPEPEERLLEAAANSYENVLCVMVPDGRTADAVVMRMESYQEPRLRRKLVVEK